MEIRTFVDTAARWLLIALIALIPFLVIPTAWSNVVQGKLLLTGILLFLIIALYIAGRLLEGTVILPRDLLMYAAVFLPVSYLLAAYAGGRPFDSYVSGLGSQDTVATMAILFSVLVLTAMLFVGRSRDILLAFLALTAGSAVVIVFQIARLIVPGPLSLGGLLAGSASSIFGSWHDLGILCGLLIFFSVALFRAPILGDRLGRWLLPALGVLSFFLALIIDMPDVWYALTAILAGLGLYQWYAARAHESHAHSVGLKRAVLPLIIAAIALGAAIGEPLIYSRIPASLQVAQTEVRPSWQGTFMIGQQVYQNNGFIFGVGPNSFQSAWDKFKPTGVNQTPYWSTDFTSGIGLIPTSFVTAGTLGVLAWLILLLALILHMIHVVRNADRPQERSLHLAVMGGALLLFAFHIIFVPSLALSVMMFFLMGLSIALSGAGHTAVFRAQLSEKNFPGVVATLILILFFVPLLAAAGTTVQTAVSDLLIQKSAADFNNGGDIAHSLSLLQTSLIVNPKNDRARRGAVELGLVQLQKLAAAGSGADAAQLKQTLENTIAQGLAAVSIDSSDYQNWLSLAGLYQNVAAAGVQGAYENARTAYEKAAAANPTNPLPLIGAAQVTLAMGQASSSITYLNATVLLKPDLAIGYYLRSQAESLGGDTGAALDDAKRTVSLAQQDPLAWYNLGAILYVSGDYQDAVLALKQAVSLNNNYSNALFVLALSYNKLEDHGSAIAAMQKVVELNPTNPTASSTLSQLIAASSTPSSKPKSGR